MKSITLELDDAILDRVRQVAVDEQVAVSAWVQDAIRREMDARARSRDRDAGMDSESWAGERQDAARPIERDFCAARHKPGAPGST